MTTSNDPTANESTNNGGTAAPIFEPIAIIGMGMRLPGGVHNAADYWDLLVNGKSGRCRVPKSRYNVDAWYGPGRANHVPTKFGYFLEEVNLAHVDPDFWSFTKQEAELMDPRQRLFLEVAYEALENSGATKFRGTDVGVYVGTMGEDWNQIESRDEQSLNQVRPDVYGDYILANRASYEFDLTGPSMVVRTACSASLVALHMACRDLHGGDCTSALVGGVNLIISPKDTAIMHQQGVLSPTASCKSFDADADGFARGEGVSAIYIKKLSDAVRDGDPIRAVIRSTCVSGNGRTPGLTTPNPKSHEKLMRRGHQLAGITDLSKTAMIECHGTGTSVGDPLEISAVANIWRDHGIYIGSVKPNIGHGEGASGLSSIIKMVLALENSTIPPNIHFNTPNEKIPWEGAKLKVPTAALPWPTDRLERVSVNSFGIGGSNAHVLLESAACSGIHSSQLSSTANPGGHKYRLLTFSAQHPVSVKASARKTKEYLDQHPDQLSNVSHSLSCRRETHAHRAFCVTNGKGDFQVSQANGPGKKTPCLVWVFTGQGAQWAQMGKELLEQEPLVQHRISQLDHVLASLPDPPSWKLSDLLLAPKGESRLDEAEFSQPCLVAIQVVLVDLLRSWSVKPKAVVGHSSGETAAAYACGAITAEEAIRIAYHRGKITLLIKAAHKGSMAAVGLGRGQVEQFLRPGVMIGCENSPSNVTLSGDAEVLEKVIQDVKGKHPEVLARSLRVECGYHSHHMKTAALDFAGRLKGIAQPRKPKVPFYSSVTGLLKMDLPSCYWVQNVVSPVLFNTAVQSVLKDISSPTFVEIGPHSALAGPIRQILHTMGRTASYVPTLVRNQDAVFSVLNSVGELWTAGVKVNLNAISPSGKFLTDLPKYTWHYDREYWIESRLSRSWRLRKFDHHELLGSRVHEVSDACPSWRCNLRVEDVAWLQDHIVRGETIFPASGFISMIGEALKQLKETSDYTVKQVHINSALILNDRQVELVTNLIPTQAISSVEGDWYEFTISSLSEGSETWVRHITGQCRAGPAHDHRVPEITRLPRKVSAESFYSTWKRFGLNYGSRFRNITNVSSHVREARANATLESLLSDHEKTSYSIHPTILDSSLHFAMIASCQGLIKNFKQISIPTHIDELYVGKASNPMMIEAVATDGNLASSTSQIVATSGGRVVINVQGLHVQAIGNDPSSQDEDPHAGAMLSWKPDLGFLDPLQVLSQQDFGICAGNLDRLVLACIVESRTQLQFLSATQQHLVKFKSWLDESYREAIAGNYPNVINAFDIATMSSDVRQEFIANMIQACKGTVTEPLALAIYRVCEDAADCFSGRIDAYSLISHSKIIEQAQDYLNDLDLTDFLQLLGHKKPDMKVLHIGGASQSDIPVHKVLSSLSSTEFGARIYGGYVYAGSSSEPSSRIQERLRSSPATTYAQLSIDIELTSHGLKNESFDLILDFGTTGPSQTALRNMRKLLKSTGCLVLQYTSQKSKYLQYILGLSPENESTLSHSTPVTVLQSHLDLAGFDGSAYTTFSGDHSSLIITAPFIDRLELSSASVVCQDLKSVVVDQAAKYLEAQGLELEFFTPGQELPWGQPVLCLLDLEGPFFHDMTPHQWQDLKKTLFSVQDEKVLWLTAASQLACKDPRYSLTLGFTRSLRRELSMDLVTLELDRFDANSWSATRRILDTFGERFTGGEVELESEYVFAQGSLQICRFHPIRVLEQMQRQTKSAEEELEKVKSETTGNARLEQMKRRSIDEVLIRSEIDAVGFDFELTPRSSIDRESIQQDDNVSVTPQVSNLRFRPDKTYVFVGGLGGLGQATARFLAERGARDLIFFSRSAEESAKNYPEYFEELQALGCTVQAISGSVDEMSDVVGMLSSARTPIAGVMQAAMVLQDINITDMTFDQWQTTVRPKVQGTWNLHEAILSQSEPLDFFFLFSSLSGLGGQIGQANYAAANAFLDAFVQYRHSLGLACSVLDIGIMEDIGVLARETERLDALRATSQHCLHEQDLLDSLELMIMRSHPKSKQDFDLPASSLSKGYTNASQVAIGMRSAATGGRKSGWQRDPRSGFMAKLEMSSERASDDRKTDETLKDFLQACRSNPEKLTSSEAKAFLAREIGGALRNFSMRHDDEVDLSLPLQTDSLVTVELRNWIRQKMGVSITVVELRSADSVYSIGEVAAVRLAAVVGDPRG